MGILMTKLHSLFADFGSNEEYKILMLGLDAAGKSTMLYKFKFSDNITTLPTIGFNVETVRPSKKVTFTVWDVGGQDKIRHLWRHYYDGVKGLIFVVDSSDTYRMQEAKEELDGILRADEMKDVPFVVIANKQDLSGAISPNDITEALSLRNYKLKKWRIQGACALTGEGIYEAIEHMSKLVKQFKKESPT